MLDLLKSSLVAGIPGEISTFFRSSHRGAFRMDRPWMKGLRYVTILRNSWSSVTFVGAGRVCTASIFSRSGWTMLASYRQQKEFMAGAFTCVFCRLNSTPYLQATCMRFCRWVSCSASVQPCMVMSSVILIHPGHSSRNWSIFFWKMFCEQTRPKGRYRKWYLPKGLLKVVKRIDSSSRTTDQYP